MDNQSGGLGSLLQFIPAFMQLMHGMNISGTRNTASALANVNNAMINPDNKLYKKMYGEYQDLGRQQLAQNVSQMEGQNRMLSAMGRTPLFAPERQGEQAFRAQAMAGPQLGVQAQQQTQDALSRAALSLGGKGGQIGAYQQQGAEQYGPRFQTGASNQNTMGLGSLGAILNSGTRAPGAQSQSLLGMLFGGSY